MVIAHDGEVRPDTGSDVGTSLGHVSQPLAEISAESTQFEPIVPTANVFLYQWMGSYNGRKIVENTPFEVVFAPIDRGRQEFLIVENAVSNGAFLIIL